MAERDTQLGRDVEVDVDVDLPEDVEESRSQPRSGEDRGLRSRLGDRAGSVLSVRGLALAVVVALAGVFLFGGLIPLGGVGNLVGIFVAAFLYGTVTDRRRYAELGLAGGGVGAGTAALGNLTLTLLGPGIPIVALGAVGGLVAGVLGHYFGRDLRDGLTRDL